jgi:cyclopropane fatty-acyl-phospholipid synthase-like methyltransferase
MVQSCLPGQEVRVPKVKTAALAKSVFRRALNPLHVARAAKRQWNRVPALRAHDDAQLKLYSQILPGDFLHYGYFDDPTRIPEEISLGEITRAQARYAELILEQVIDRDAPVLDIGCGMGGLSRMLLERGFDTVALTPNRTQAAHVRAALGAARMLECRLEDVPTGDHRQRFGTVITAESLQYLKLDQAVRVIEQVLKPGGRWVVCDYFRLEPAHEKSGHDWAQFVALVESRGWRLRVMNDITPNVLPTLRCIHMWASRLGLPLIEFVTHRLRRKQPALHYLLEEAMGLLTQAARDNFEAINPTTFARQKKYMLLVMEQGQR